MARGLRAATVLLAASLVAQGSLEWEAADDHDASGEALARGDECEAGSESGAETCALSALQRRALRKARHTAEPADLPELERPHDGPSATCSPAFTPKTPSLSQDCRQTQACCDPSLTCFEKGPLWAACMRSCKPGIHSEEPRKHQAPWTCRVLSKGETTLPATTTTTSAPSASLPIAPAPPPPPFATTSPAPAVPTLPPAPALPAPPAPTPPQDTSGCSEHPGYSYSLDWSASGASFFSNFNFLREDTNHGTAEYLSADAAEAQGVVQAYSTHAILRAGPASTQYKYKRASAKIATTKSWKYFLAAMRYTRLPYGCGVWPAFWTNAVGTSWPDGGELDIFEYVNDSPQQTSFHTGVSNRCTLNAAEVNRCRAMPDANRMNYDCVTAYPKKLGCAPNTRPLSLGRDWAYRAGIVAVEWTESFLKVFFIPDGEVPASFDASSPKPDTWDRYLISYYPFGASHRADPSSCPDPANVMAPQQLVLNIGFCGDWASKVWKQSSCGRSVASAKGCRATDPLLEYAPDQDCCTQFIWDAESKFGTDSYLKDRAYFNISWIKVYQH